MTRILITGATGFIGGRLAEVACQLGIPTVALVRTWARAALLSRLPLTMVPGDILELDTLRRAVRGCDVVFHCAVDFRRIGMAHRRSSVLGTRNVLQAAAEARVKRVVFLSSIAVYGRTPPPRIVTEDEPVRHTGDNYGDGKLDAERLALRTFLDRGIPVAVLRPTIVYGPFGGYWTPATVGAIKNGSMVLVNGGSGVCNCLYVDNLVQAMLLAAQHPGAPGEVFHVSDESPVPWKEFVEGHARALGDGFLPLPEMTVEEIEAARARLRQRRPSSIKQTLTVLKDPRIRMALRSIPAVAQVEAFGKAIVRNVLPVRAQHFLRETVIGWTRSVPGSASGVTDRPLLPRGMVQVHASRTVFSVEKARRVLGYAPRVDFHEGMERTAAWIRWARL
ncbi:MAG: NAD-dependent epimerase/dehydratase family protein [Armatimonadota bacterium]|nr:NAD-dependent epimerase/dehydratase family protein [Armatimonadota bacterium]